MFKDIADKAIIRKTVVKEIDKLVKPIISNETSSSDSDSLNLSDEDDYKKELIFKTTKEEIKSYLIKPKDTVSEFYSKYHKQYSRLAQCVDHYLIAPATSVPSERLFSHAEFQIWNRRNQLSSEAAEDIMLIIYENHKISCDIDENEQYLE